MVIVVKKAGYAPEIIKTNEISLELMQKLVGGLIDRFYIGEGIDMWLNDEGKLLGLEPNMLLLDEDGIADLVVGDVFFASSDEEGNTIGLNSDQLEDLTARFVAAAYHHQESLGDIALFPIC